MGVQQNGQTHLAREDSRTVLELAGGFRWVRITSLKGLDDERLAMEHFMGQVIPVWDSTILSLRDAENRPHCTVEWQPQRRSIAEIQGPAGQPVAERYHLMVRDLIQHLNPLEVNDAFNFGHLFVSVNGERKRLLTWRELRSGDEVCGDLNLSHCADVTHLPADLVVDGDLALFSCRALRGLPDGLRVSGSIDLLACSSMTRLPDGLHVHGSLDMTECAALTHLPKRLQVGGGLHLGGCTGMSGLPDDLAVDGSIWLPDGSMARSVHEARTWFAAGSELASREVQAS